ncbi:hypothetical protein BVX95_00505, partial [archaeon D22]
MGAEAGIGRFHDFEKGKIRHEHPGFELFVVFSLSTFVFLTIELISRIQDLYKIFPLIDVVTHFLAGFAMFHFAIWLATVLKDR